jgi:F-type H+-transporting ATPase subunit gamma
MTNIKPYSLGLSATIQNLLPNINLSEIKLSSSFAKNDKKLIIAITSNRGLCGGFNANIVKGLNGTINKGDEIVCIGKKGAESFKRRGRNIVEEYIDILDNCSQKKSKEISQKIINGFLQGQWSKVLLVYNSFKNAGTQIIKQEQVLPIKLNDELPPQKLKQDYIFEPDKTQIINKLVPDKIHTHLFEAILNSIASEHGARMTAMHKATDNANELKQTLTLSYNRQRQAAITNEILEIVAGAEALKGS